MCKVSSMNYPVVCFCRPGLTEHANCHPSELSLQGVCVSETASGQNRPADFLLAPHTHENNHIGMTPPHFPNDVVSDGSNSGNNWGHSLIIVSLTISIYIHWNGKVSLLLACFSHFEIWMFEQEHLQNC